jgi:hypothetical protein
MLIWDLLEPGRRRLKEVEKDLRTLWNDLAMEDGAAAYRASTALILAGEKGVELLRNELRAVPEDSKRKTIEQLFEELQARKFESREAAARLVRARGWEAAASLRQALDKAPSVDFKRQVEMLIADLGTFRPAPTAVRSQRAIRVLERIDSREAQQVLETLSKGAEWAEQTREAQAALARLKQGTHQQRRALAEVRATRVRSGTHLPFPRRKDNSHR